MSSIARPLLGGGEPCLPDSSLLVVATCHGSSLALDRRSPAARLCCRNAAKSTSEGNWVGGDTSLRFPLRSRGRTIFDTCRQHKSVGENTTMEQRGRRRGGLGRCGGKRGPMAAHEDLWPRTYGCTRTYTRSRPRVCMRAEVTSVGKASSSRELGKRLRCTKTFEFLPD